MDNNIKKEIKKDFTYPEYDDKKFQSKIYKKREFYYHRIPENKEFKNYKDIKSYREEICGGKLNLYTHQSFLANFINPSTPYKGLLIFHGVGTGKTGTAISIAENFKDMVKRYNTKIYILVTGPLLKENWKDEIVKFTGQKKIDDLINQRGYLDDQEKLKANREILKESLQYYKIMTHRSFYKKVLGEKIKDIEEIDTKKGKYRYTETGEIERDISIDKIENLDNSLLIVDEAHNFTGNEHGDALKKIVKKSKNLRLLLLSATPMKNLGDDIIELLNYLRPEHDQIRRDKVFNSNKDYLMDFKDDGREYLKKMCNGYISYYRGANPLLFAKREDVGQIPPGLIYTKCVRCVMEPFQQKTYDRISTDIEDPLERSTSSVANISLPGLSKDKKSIIGYKGEEGINIIKSNLKSNKKEYLKLLNKTFFNGKLKNEEDIIYESRTTQNITGLLLKKNNLKKISTKFYEVLNNIDEKIDGKKGSGTIFVYSNLVKVGIEIFMEILLQNGYLEFREDQNYLIGDDVIDYKTGIKFKDFNKNKQNRDFYPATFIRITGKTDDQEDEIPEMKKMILDKYFNNIENREGKFLKVILGSRVMNEGITLENTSEVHILDVYYNFGRVDQVIGRAIRQCKHYNVITEKNPFPVVKVYKYVVKLPNNKLSSEENLYRKAEVKYILVKNVERVLKESSIDCAINYNGNVFINEVKDNKKCTVPKIGVKIKNIKDICNERCDFAECDYNCYDNSLNLEYYDRKSYLFKKISKNKLDYSTFTNNLAKNEIKFAKETIMDLFRIKYVYTLREILEEVKNMYKDEKKELFEDWFVYQALDILVPTNKNDHINFKDTIYDKYNVAGYLIYRGYFYIFQPYEENEDVPIFYRKTFRKELIRQLSLYSYLNYSNENKFEIKEQKEDKEVNKKNKYDFQTGEQYYNEREEFEIVGIIDKFSGARKFTIGRDDDIFKIRGKREKVLDKKRGTGIPSAKGAVCYSSKDKDELKKIALKINMDSYKKDDTRIDTCMKIKNRLLFLEKFSTGKNNITYMIVPFNHPVLPFPLNLEDRIRYVEQNFNELENTKVKFTFKNIGDGIFDGNRNKKYARYSISFKYSGNISKNTKDLLDKYNFNKKGTSYEAIFE